MGGINLQTTQTNVANEHWADIQVSILLEQLDPNVRAAATFIKFTEIGRDQEYWAGNFGSQFTGESMSLIIEDPQKDLLKKMSPKRFLDLPIQTYFNDGVGLCCYIDGIKFFNHRGHYNILNDFDYAFCYPTKKVPAG
jgi:hypothetical protein